MTLEEVNAQLALVNEAILRVIQGKHLLEFTIRTGPLARTYKKNDITLNVLREYRDELLLIKQTLEDIEPSFRKGSSFKVVATK